MRRRRPPGARLAGAEPIEMLSNKAAASGRSGGGIRIGRLWLRPAAASGRSGGGIGRLRLRPAIPIVPGGRGKRQRRAAAAVPPLPDDALVEILSRVPAKSLCRFKCVSRAWRDLIADRLRCNRLPQTLEGFFYTYDGNDETKGGSRDAGGVSPVRAVHGRFINTLGKSSPLASFSFLGKVPGIEELGLLHSCNGLLLFGHRRAGDSYDSLGYIVCNPATEQWVAVPSSGWIPDYVDESDDSDSNTETSCTFTYLVFDPATSLHFQLVQFWVNKNSHVVAVHTYSSETGVWCERMSTWHDDIVAFFAGSAFFGGMLHFSNTHYCGWEPDLEIIVAVDGEGGSCNAICGPQKLCDVVFVGHSQGRLHYMHEHGDSSTGEMTGLSIWVLQVYGTEEWVLKHSVTFLQLFGRMSCQVQYDYSVIAIHPDRNLIFFFQHRDLELKSYDMDSKEVCTLHTLGVCPRNILPYVPYFAESSALVGKH